MTLSLNPTLTQEKQEQDQNKEIQVNNIDIVTQHKPMQTQEAQAQEPEQQQQTQESPFNIDDPEYQEYTRQKLEAKKLAHNVNNPNEYKKELSKQFFDKKSDMQKVLEFVSPVHKILKGREDLEVYNISGDKQIHDETRLYDYIAKYNVSAETLGLKNFDEAKLQDAKIRQGMQHKTDFKQLSQEEKDYLKRGQNWFGAGWDKLIHSEEKRVNELLKNHTRKYLNEQALTDIHKVVSTNTSLTDIFRGKEHDKEQKQRILNEGQEIAKRHGYKAFGYDIKLKDYFFIDTNNNRLYIDSDGFSSNADKFIVNNYYDVVGGIGATLAAIPTMGGSLAAYAGATGARVAGGVALKEAAKQTTKQGLKTFLKQTGKEAGKAAALTAALSPLDYAAQRKDLGMDTNTAQMLNYSAGNAMGAAAGVMAIAGVAKGASKTYHTLKDIKDLDLSELKNIKVSRYLDNEEASIHRKLAKFNKSEIDSNYEMFKNLQSDRVISKEMKDPTFMGNFIDKIGDYNVLKRFSSKKESQDKLLSALFSNKELAREFAGKLTSEEAAIVNKAIHAMGENFTRLSKEYEQQIIDEYAKTGKIKGQSPHVETQSGHVERSETSNTNANKDVSPMGQHDKGLNQYDNTKEKVLNKKNDSNFTYITQETKGIKDLRNDLMGVLSQYKTQPITNKETGMQGFITTDEMNKISSKKAIDKSVANGFSRDEHFKVAQDLKSLFENSKLKESHADNKQREHIKVHRFIQDLSINDKEAQAKITLFEKIQGKNKIYTIELESLDKPDSLSVSMRNTESAVKAQSVATAHPETTTIAKTDADIIPQNLPEVYKHMLDEIDKQAKADYKTSITNLQNALSDTDFKATLLQGYKQVTDDAIESLGLDNQLTNTLIRETQKLESKPSISLTEAIELRKNINEIMRNYNKSSSDLKKFRANKHLDNIKDNIDNAIKNALDSKVAQNEAHLGRNVESKDVMLSESETSLKQNTPNINTLTRQEADELFSNFQQANKNYAQIKEALNDKFAKAMTKGMNKKDLDSRLTIEQWKQRVLDTQWGDSVKGLENTIFKNFNPRMQKHTQMLTILRALDRNVKLNDDSMPIDFTKILSDIENLEKLTLHPEIYPILDTFKSYAKSYQFSQEIAKAKALENQVGGGALATTLEGRIKVFLTNRLFKKLFAFIPYIGDNSAITKALQSAIKDLKYPSEITLETLKVLNKADLEKGYKPIKDAEKPRFEYRAHTPLSDTELQSQIKNNKQILTPQDKSEIEALASNPLIQNIERQAKYNEEVNTKINQFEANKENIQQDILNNLVVATQEIKQNTELLKQLATQLTQNNPIHTPNKSIIKAQIDKQTYFITTDKNNIAFIEKQETQNLTQPKTYDELMQRERDEATMLDSTRNQYVEIAERKERELEKQLLLEYKPEVAKANPQSGHVERSETSINPHTESSPDSVMLSAKHETSNTNANKDVSPTAQHDNTKDTDLLKNLYGNNRETSIYANMESNPNIKAQQKALNETDSIPQINFNAPTKQVKSQMLEALKPIFNQTMTSSDGVQAHMSLKSLSKMTSDKAIQKSIDNGFSREEHLKAVLDIQRLFENAKLAQTHTDNKGLNKNVLIHRLNSELENGNALITTKESLDTNKNRVYSLELELIPRFNDEMRPTDIKSSEGGFSSPKHTADQSVATIAKTDIDIIPQKTLKGDSITNPDISYAIQHENISKDLAQKIANNAEIDTIIKRDDFNKAEVSYFDKNNMTLYSANIGNYIDDEFGMMGDKFFLNNVRKNEFYIPPTKSLQDFKEQSLNQIEHLKNAIKTEIDNAKDEKELHKTIREIKLKARENAERRFFDDTLYEERTQAREFYATKYDEAMQEMANYYDKKFTNTLNNEIDSIQIESKTPQEIVKQAKQSGKSVKETKELIKDSITMQSNAHLGSGFLGEVMSGKSIERLAKNPKAKAVMERIYLKKDIIPKMQQGKKVNTQEVIKILETSPQKGRDMVVIGKENFTPEVVEYILNSKGGSKKVAVDILPQEQAQKLGFKYPKNVRRTIDKAEMMHALNRHGENGEISKARKQPPLTKEHLSKWTQYADEADMQVFSKDDLGQDVIVSGKQINGHYVIVESIRKKQNELGFKTMYFERGDLKDNPAFDLAVSKDTPSTQGYKPELEQG